jgi:hypothetical protein
MEVVRDPQPLEARSFGHLRLPDQLPRTELLTGQEVPDAHHGPGLPRLHNTNPAVPVAPGTHRPHFVLALLDSRSRSGWQPSATICGDVRLCERVRSGTVLCSPPKTARPPSGP